jgi:hypothetical protein
VGAPALPGQLRRAIRSRAMAATAQRTQFQDHRSHTPGAEPVASSLPARRLELEELAVEVPREQVERQTRAGEAVLLRPEEPEVLVALASSSSPA